MTPTTEMQNAAKAVNDALSLHGYCQTDQPLYKAYQVAAGLTPDGFPGRNTMVSLQAALSFAGIAPANVTIYPWTADANGGGDAAYDGVNAPTLAQWTSCSGGPSPVTPPPGVLPPVPVSPPASTSSSGVGPLPYIIGAVVVAGALAAYTYSKKRKR